jgi:hypothetical protein
MEIIVLLDMTPCSVANIYQCFGGEYTENIGATSINIYRTTGHHIPTASNLHNRFLRFEVFMAVTMKITVFWGRTPGKFFAKFRSIVLPPSSR